MAKQIIPHLWFDREAKEAAQLYVSLIEGSKVTHQSTMGNTPSGDTDIVSFTLADQPFMSISAGPVFKPNPSISFHIKCKTPEEVDAIWAKLSSGGTPLMELGSYPFSPRYGWIQDKYGFSWQVIYREDASMAQRITPVLMFASKAYGKAKEAMDFYTSAFEDSKIQMVQNYEKDDEPDTEDTVKYGGFTILGKEFGAMDSARAKFDFNEAISFMVMCDTQEEIDEYWEKLSADPQAEQCGWLKDKFGVSWQIVPTAMNRMMAEGDPVKRARVTEAFLKMKKFDIAELEKAYNG